MPFLTSYFHIHYIFNVIKSHSCSLHSTNQTIFYISLHISTTMRNMLCKFLIIAVLVKSSCKHSLFPSPTLLTLSKPLPDCFFLCDLCCIIRIHISTMIGTVILRTGCRFPHHHTARAACTCVI